MRAFLTILFLLLPAAAQAFDDPKSLLDAIYAPYQAGKKHETLDVFYSNRLKGLFIDHGARVTDEVPAVGEGTDAVPSRAFNPFLDSDNALLLDVKISEPMVLGDGALAMVSFHNFDHPSLLSIAMVKESDGWKVDDVTSTGAGENWMLSWLLLYDPWDVK
ncbi:MAG TPA: hypothetical protein VIN06_00400 [Devosia sp.]